MEELKFVRCPETKNVSEVLYVADGAGLELLKANSTDAAGEKHVPVVSQDGNVVKVVVGSVEHPMTDAHYIEWILLETDKGVQIRHLTPSDAPKAVFEIGEGKPLAVYEYCNLHGLWKAE